MIQSSPSSSFEAAVRPALQRLRTAFLGVLEGLSEPPQRPADLERALGLNTKLAWQVHRVAYSADPLLDAEHVPGGAGVRLVLDRARKRGAPAETIAEVAEAFDAFERVVQEHAGDRALFAAMAGSVAEPQQEQLSLKLRRDHFRLASRMWGIQAQTLLGASIYYPGKSPDLIDCVTVRGAVDLVRLRADASIMLSRHRISEGAADTPRDLDPLKVDGDGAIESRELLAQFSTQPLPEFAQRREGRLLISELKGNAIGRTGAFTYFLADVARDLAWHDPDPLERTIWQNTGVQKPCEVLTMDVMFYDGMFGAISPRAGMYADVTDRPSERDRLPMDVKVTRLGYGPSAMHMHDFRRYAAMIEHVCERMRLDASKLEVFRCRVEYPPLHAVLSMMFPLPENGNW